MLKPVVASALISLAPSVMAQSPEPDAVPPAPAPEAAPGTAPVSEPVIANLDAVVAAAAAGADRGADAAVAEEQETAAATPLSGFRGGTLGFPTEGASSVVAAAKVQSQGAPFDTAILARAGALDIATVADMRLTVDVLGEVVPTDVPVAEFALGQRPLPRLVGADLVSLGFRIRLSPTRTADLEQKVKQFERQLRRNYSLCATLRMNVDSDAACKELLQTFQTALDAEGSTFDPDAVERIVAAEVLEFETAHLHGFSVATGARFLYRKADETGAAAAGLAGELNLQYSARSVAFFGSGSFLLLNDAENFNASEPDSVATVQEALVETKGTFGFYWQGHRDTGILAPRVGAYYSYFRNWWDNRFANPGTDGDISGYQHEGAVFFSGTFSNGVSGLFSFGIRKPYGHETEPQFIFGFSPAFGDQVGKAEQEPGAAR